MSFTNKPGGFLAHTEFSRNPPSCSSEQKNVFNPKYPAPRFGAEKGLVKILHYALGTALAFSPANRCRSLLPKETAAYGCKNSPTAQCTQNRFGLRQPRCVLVSVEVEPHGRASELGLVSALRGSSACVI